VLTALTVVVPTRDRPAHLAACLEALSLVVGDDDEVVVVDSASVAPVAVAAEGVRVIRLDEPGTSRARNAGWRSASHDVVAFVDDDVRVAPGWADAVRNAIVDPSVAFVTGRLAPGGPAERLVAVKDDDAAAVLDASTAGTLGHAANLAVRRSALVAVGGFDERLGPGSRFRAAEDLDLFDRLLAAGFVGRYEPTASGVHDQWRDRRQLLALDWGYGIGAGARLAKLARADRSRLRGAMRDWIWRAGIRDGVVGAARQRHEFGVATAVARLAGTAVGFIDAASRRRP
jgi:glycosyltransferase involved in cell wall biosynthesis